MKKLNVAVLGLGKIGLGYDLDNPNGVMSHTKAFLNNQHYYLLLGVDPDGDARNKFEDFSKANSYSSVDEIPDNIASEIDIIVIATPSVTRVEDCEKNLKKFLNASFIVLEKPIALTLSEVRCLKDLFIKNNLVQNVFVNYMRRCDPHFVNLRNRIRAGEWGNVRKLDISYPGDLINMGSHFIDLINFFFDLDFKVISKKYFHLNPNNDFRADAELMAGDVSFKIYPSLDGELELFLLFEKGMIKVLNSGRKIVIEDKEMVVDLSRYQETVVDHLTAIIQDKIISLSDFNSAEKALVICEDIRKF